MRIVRPLMLGAALLAATTTRASAQDVIVAGDAKGCFGLGCTPTDNASITFGGPNGVLVEYLSSSLDFNGLALDGFLGVNSVTGNFGQLKTTTTGLVENVNSYFSLLLSFTNPLAPNVLFREISLTGNLNVDPNTGALVINFDDVNGVSPWVPFTDVLSDPVQTGEMQVTAFTTDVPSNGMEELTGTVELRNVTATPEPASMALMGTGLAGLAGWKRRRSKKTA